MAQRHKSWIAFFIKIMMIVIMGHLWISEAFAGSEKGNKTTETITEYYWVGGSGNWSDLSHWATSSGGSEKHEFLPNQYSNVHFDENSFTAEGQEVILDGVEAFCRDMVWTGATNSPTLRGSDPAQLVRIRQYGSLTLIPSMTLESANLRFIFLALSGEHSITSGSHKFEENMFFEGSDCIYTLQDSLSARNLNVYGGTFITNNKKVITTNCRISENAAASLGSSTFVFSDYFSVGGQLDAGTSTILGKNPNNAKSLRFETYGGVVFSFNKIIFESAGSLNLYRSDVHEAIFHKHVSISGFATIDKLELLDDGAFGIASSSTVQTLLLTEGKTYKISDEGKLKVDSLRAIGTCEKPIVIQSFVNNDIKTFSNATIQKESGTVKIEYVRLNNISADGGAVFTGENVVATGEVTGWIFSSPEPRDLFWVGGSGSWYNNNHWSATSGGTGGECAPSAIDNVYFDENSFLSTDQTVDVDVDIEVHHMDWSSVLNQPTFSIAPGNTMNVYGSFMLSDNMSFTNDQNLINFLSTGSSETVKTSGFLLGKSAYFNGTGSQWILQDSLATDDEIIIHNGTLQTNDQNLNTGVLNVVKQGSLFMGSSTIRLSKGFVACSFYDAGTSNIYVGGEDYDGQTGRIFTGQDLHNVYFTGNTGMLITDAVETGYTSTGKQNCKITVPDTLRLNNLVFYKNAKLQNEGTKVIANKINIIGDSDASGTFITDSLELGIGSVNNLDNASFQFDYLATNGFCNAYTEIYGGYFEPSMATVIEYCILQNVSGSDSSILLANNCIDLGNNTGLTLDAQEITDLYWVGGTGAWSDPNHWAISSGGSGGSCLPNIATNVHFDSNSFTEEGQEISIDVGSANFRDMNWTGALFNPTLSGDTTTMMRCYGSFILAPNMSYEYEGKAIEFLSSQPAETIATNNNQLLCDLHFSEIKGEWHLNDDLNIAGALWLDAGVLDTKGYDVKVQNLLTDYVYPYSVQAKSKLRLNDSHVFVSGSETIYASASLNDQVEAGTSTFIISKGGDINTRSNLHNVIYSDIGTDTRVSSFRIQDEEVSKSFNNITFMSSGNVRMTVNLPPADQYFNKVTFLGNGDISVKGKFIIDSLIISAGTNNSFSGSPDIQINKHLDMKGTSCAPILLNNYFDENSFSITIPNGTLSAKYVKLKGVQISGINTFYAGEGSEDLGGNDGWVFETDPEFEGGFLGNDRVIDAGLPIQLDATHYGPDISYLWNTGETTSTIKAKSCGEYSVQVLLKSGCIAYDTINITSTGVLVENLIEEISAGTCQNYGEVSIDQEILSTSLSGYKILLASMGYGDTLLLPENEYVFSNLNPGTYILLVDNQAGCVSILSKEILVSQENSTLPANFIVEAQNATCAQKGEITIDRSAIDNVAAPYSITLTSAFSGSELVLVESDSVFVNLTEDTYILTVIDSAGCVYDYTDDIIINLDESGCGSSIISPDFGESLTVPFQGKVNIYNRNGGLVRTFDAPGEWDGTDSRGQTVPIGVYILIADENRDQIIQVTVIR